MKYAFVADIHANLQAWRAVWEDISADPVDHVVSLGDVVGYGPRPVETFVEVCSHVDDFILGDHDAVVAGLRDVTSYDAVTQHMIAWTAEKFGGEMRQFFQALPYRLELEEEPCAVLCVHGAPDTPERFAPVTGEAEARAVWRSVPHSLVVTAHTHAAVVHCLTPQGLYEQRAGTALTMETGWRYIVDCGAVGIATPDAPVACYCRYDARERRVVWRHVPFDVDEFVEDLCGMPEEMAELLPAGREWLAAGAKRRPAPAPPEDASSAPPEGAAATAPVVSTPAETEPVAGKAAELTARERSAGDEAAQEPPRPQASTDAGATEDGEGADAQAATEGEGSAGSRRVTSSSPAAAVPATGQRRSTTTKTIRRRRRPSRAKPGAATAAIAAGTGSRPSGATTALARPAQGRSRLAMILLGLAVLLVALASMVAVVFFNMPKSPTPSPEAPPEPAPVAALTPSVDKPVRFSFTDDLDGWRLVRSGGDGALTFDARRVMGDDWRRGRVVVPDPFANRDDPHPTLVLRSPPFQLGRLGDVTVMVRGGCGGAISAPLNIDVLPTASRPDGFLGVALRRVSDDAYVLSRRRAAAGTAWQELRFRRSALSAATAKDSADESYTLDLIDAYHGDVGWLALDDVVLFQGP